MRINSEIIDYFLKYKHLEDYKNHWIYDVIIPGKYTFEEPEASHHEKLTHLVEEVKNQISHFKPLNEKLWNQMFEGVKILHPITLYLIVGSPKPYDAMVRKNQNETVIILDLVRILDYIKDLDQAHLIINQFLTHEMAHLLIESKYPYADSMSIEETFIQMIFDEGIAHFISYQENVLTVNWESDEMKQHAQHALKTLRYDLNHRHEISEQTLIEANSGTYWGKYASIAGMFAIKKYYDLQGNFLTLLKEGPIRLLELIPS